MYFDDAPIKKQEDDLLNRQGFAKRLGKSLIETEAPNGYCVGLFGPWGSGKSSIINMVLEEIRRKSELDKLPVMVMTFNPWNFSSSDQLLRQYFIMLADKFTTTKDKQLSKIGEEIQKYAGMFEVFGDVGKAISDGWKHIGKVLQRRSISGDNDITKQRNKIIEALSKQNSRIIVVIDDIDRLSNEEIKQVFQLVNSVAKFPNIIYLLSFDKEIVARALGEVQNYDGERYLEKIIQVPIEIPETPRACLRDIMFNRLNYILEHHPQMVFEQEYWSKVFYECVSKYICTIRDVVRIVNGLNIKCDMIGEEINFADMVAITVIENKIPELYRWIKGNKAKLVGTPDSAWQFIGKKEAEIANIYKEDILNLNRERCEEYTGILKILFPYFASKLSASVSYGSNDNLRRDLRIGHADIIDRYFVLDLEAEDISRKEFNSAIEIMNVRELETYFITVNRKKGIINCLNELKARLDDISEARSGVVIKALFNTAVEFEGETKNSILGLSAFPMTIYIIRDLFKKLGNEEKRYCLLQDIIQEADSNSIQVISYFVNIIELAFGRLAAKGVENGRDKLIKLEQLEECEKILLYQISKCSNECSILEMKYARSVLHIYESLDNEGYLKYMSICLKDDLNKLIFVGFSAEKWTSGSAVSWRRNQEYEVLVSDEEFEVAYMHCLKDKRIFTMNRESLHRVVALMLWKEKEFDWDGDVPDKKVEERIMEIRKKYL